MTSSLRKAKLEIEIEIDIPIDIINDKQRFSLVEEGIIRSISKGLYEQGVSFRILRSNMSWMFENPRTCESLFSVTYQFY